MCGALGGCGKERGASTPRSASTNSEVATTNQAVKGQGMGHYLHTRYRLAPSGWRRPGSPVLQLDAARPLGSFSGLIAEALGSGDGVPAAANAESPSGGMAELVDCELLER